jgi:hypothetical protein
MTESETNGRKNGQKIFPCGMGFFHLSEYAFKGE